MKCVLLCAGYATRLYPLTENTPKALLPINGQLLLSYTLEKIESVDSIDEVIVVSNSRFFKHFQKWKEEYNGNKKLHILDDGTQTNETRLGGIGDLELAIRANNISEDLLVIAGDTLFNFNMHDLLHFFKNHRGMLNAVYSLGDREKAKRFGVVQMKGDVIVDFVEKPSLPKSDIVSLALYILPREDIPKVSQYLSTQLPRDGPGNLIAHYCKHQIVYGFKFNGKFYDIGVPQDYEEANGSWK